MERPKNNQPELTTEQRHEAHDRAAYWHEVMLDLQSAKEALERQIATAQDKRDDELEKLGMITRIGNAAVRNHEMSEDLW